MDFTKVVRIGTARTYGGRAYSVYCKIKYSDGRLSITGVEGPTNGGNCLGGCGQINLLEAGIVNFAPGWDQGKLETFSQIWEQWHLNDMRASCEHQRNLGWDTERIDPTKETGWHVNIDNANLKGWVPEVAGGYLSKPCPVCGYKYGTAWLREDVPAVVLDWLRALPDTDQTPAWV
jgi:hypothetical protein